MGDHQYDMAGEKRPPTLLPEGARLVRVTELIFGKSKKGNDMFTGTIEDVKTKKSMQVWMVAEPKKRWLLKSLLTACEIPAGQDGVYDWSVTDVIGKKVIAMVEHFTEPWINTEGVEVMVPKCKVTEFIQPDHDASGEALAWEE